MSWVESGAVGVVARTNRRGSSHWMRFDDISLPLRSWCPSLPWHDSPTKDSTTLPYAAVALVMWGAFVNQNSQPVFHELGIFKHIMDMVSLNDATDSIS